MNKTSRIVRSRAQRSRAPKGKFGIWGLGTAGCVSLILVGLVLAGILVSSRVTSDLPSYQLVPILLNPPDGELLQPTRIYDRSGSEVLWTFQNSRLSGSAYAQLDLEGDQLEADIPTVVVKAFLAAADPDYLNRPVRGTSRWLQPLAETIGGRLTADLLLWTEQDHPFYAARLNILTNQLLQEYGREQVLEWYLNNLSFGNHVYGAGAAARVYFDKEISALNLAEAALLASVGETPSLNPWDSPTAARENQLDLLQKMEQEGFISARERRTAVKSRLIFTTPDEESVQEPYYAGLILNQAEHFIPRARLLRGGLSIRSSLDADLQAQVECTADFEMARLRGEDPGLPQNCAAARLLPARQPLELANQTQISLETIMLEPRTGEVLAALGETGTGLQLDPLVPHNPGTLLTPFIYLAAFTQGMEPASLVWDVPLENVPFEAGVFHPGCQENCQFVGPVSIRTALGNDYLSPAVDFWYNQGPARVENMIKQVGIELAPGICSDCEFFPGSHKMDVLEAAHGYSVFSNLGDIYGWDQGGQSGNMEPILVLDIRDISGGIWKADAGSSNRSVLSEQLAYLVNHALSDENAHQYSWQDNLFDIGRPAAVKAGMTASGENTWTAGYTTRIVTVVWVGRQGNTGDSRPTDFSYLASGIWRALTQYASRDVPIENWNAPDGIQTVDVCYPSGKLPTSYCPEIVREIFIEGNQPVERDDLYQVLEVNRETGRLATVFTPPELIETRTYLQIPEKARDWAEGEGIPRPPESYDPGMELTSHDDLVIQSPQNYASVRGVLELKGSIEVEDFTSYRVQIGKGLNPTTWQQIVDEQTRRPAIDRLGTWDTTRVEDGLYALQLVVLREDQRVEKATVLVSVDNTPPEMDLKGIRDGEQIDFVSGKAIYFSVEAFDEAGMERVDYYLNSRLVVSRKKPPYLYAWDMGLGDFNLKIIGYDRAGNQSTQTVKFSVKR